MFWVTKVLIPHPNFNYLNLKLGIIKVIPLLLQVLKKQKNIVIFVHLEIYCERACSLNDIKKWNFKGN